MPAWKSSNAGSNPGRGESPFFRPERDCGTHALLAPVMVLPAAQHLHDHLHHPTDDPAGPGAHRRTPPLSHLTVLELLLRTSHLWCSNSVPGGTSFFGAHAPALQAIAPFGQSFLTCLLRPPPLQSPDPVQSRRRHPNRSASVFSGHHPPSNFSQCRGIDRPDKRPSSDRDM